MSVAGKIAEATAAASVKFSLRAFISFVIFRVTGYAIDALIVLNVYANKLAILFKCGTMALVTLMFRAIPGGGKHFCSFNIKLMAFCNQYFLVFWNKM